MESKGKERTGYPTQKPLALLERIIKASSDEGDVVLDPFCGCATTCVAAENTGRQWIGIDVSQKAYDLVKLRLDDEVARPNDLPTFRKEIHLKVTPPPNATILERVFARLSSSTSFRTQNFQVITRLVSRKMSGYD